MRVGLLHFTSPPVAGGVESIIGAQATVLREHGHNVRIITGRGRPLPGSEFAKIPLLASTNPSIRAASTALARGHLPESLCPVTEELRSQLTRVLTGVDILLVHNAMTLHFNVPASIALSQLAAEDSRRSMIAWTHDVACINPLYRDEIHSGFPWDIFRCPQPGIVYVCISETRRLELLEAWDLEGSTDLPEVRVIPNGIFPLAELRIPASLQSTLQQVRKHSPLMLCPVRITKRKHLELAIEAVAELRRRSLDPALIISGPTWGHHPQRSQSYLTELMELSRRLQVDDCVVFLAHELSRALRPGEMSSLYDVADILLLTSESEGFGLPVLEAGLHRLPVVATDLPVFREVGGSGITYVPVACQARIVADAVEVTMGTPSLRDGVLRDYSWDVIYEARIRPLLLSLAPATTCKEQQTTHT